MMMGMGGAPAPAAGDNAGKIFAGALPQNCTNEQLLAWASQFGAVVSAEVKMDMQTGNSRGFGFITFQDPSVAQAVVANNANNVMEGKKIDCKPFGQPDKGGGKGAGLNDPSNPRMFIGGLPKTATDEALQAHFGQFGQITEFHMKKGPDGLCGGFCFVTFADPASAKMVLDNYDNNMFEGKWIDCKSAVKGGGKGGGKDMMKGMMGMMMMKGMMMKGMGKGKGWGPY
eukprot:TRINITY_DN3085_c1_g4_i1.p1 TRINITY_DN3085_c1_g4~~TRINITY_DN3085_c1_g4_i1.p1  ORF type:complete len:248 (+),score=68.34 TRINITY_DN3085_c1_g4_i1:63-746(+)